MGHVITGQWKPYQYLVESIRKFPCQVRFENYFSFYNFVHNKLLYNIN